LKIQEKRKLQNKPIEVKRRNLSQGSERLKGSSSSSRLKGLFVLLLAEPLVPL
jgi:hypothetical protein